VPCPIELAAATAMLDEEHQNLPQDGNDTNLYTAPCSMGVRQSVNSLEVIAGWVRLSGFSDMPSGFSKMLSRYINSLLLKPHRTIASAEAVASTQSTMPSCRRASIRDSK
jgi:hypothetical protein